MRAIRAKTKKRSRERTSIVGFALAGILALVPPARPTSVIELPAVSPDSSLTDCAGAFCRFLQDPIARIRDRVPFAPLTSDIDADGVADAAALEATFHGTACTFSAGGTLSAPDHAHACVPQCVIAFGLKRCALAS